MIPKSPGAHKIDVSQNLSFLFKLDERIAKATPSLLPLENEKEFLEFLTKHEETDTYIWNDKDGNTVGFFVIIDFPNENMCELYNIGVDPKFQGKGYGKKMMSFAEELAKNNKRDKMKLVTNVKNIQAVDFYKRIEYRIIKEVPNYYGDGETRYLFEKKLN